jgi:hypothetical protein
MTTPEKFRVMSLGDAIEPLKEKAREGRRECQPSGFCCFLRNSSAPGHRRPLFPIRSLRPATRSTEIASNWIDAYQKYVAKTPPARAPGRAWRRPRHRTPSAFRCGQLRKVLGLDSSGILLDRCPRSALWRTGRTCASDWTMIGFTG